MGRHKNKLENAAAFDAIKAEEAKLAGRRDSILLLLAYWSAHAAHVFFDASIRMTTGEPQLAHIQDVRVGFKHFLEDMRSIMEFASVVRKVEELLETHMPYGGNQVANAVSAAMLNTDTAEFAALRLVGDGAIRNLVAHHYVPIVSIQMLNGVPEFVCDALEAEGPVRPLSVRVRGTLDAVIAAIKDGNIL